MIKGSMQEEDITIANIYAPQIGAPQYLRQMLTAIKRKLESNTIIVGDFNTPLSPMERSSKMKINKETQALNDTLNKMDFQTFHPKTTEYTFFSSVHGTFSRIDHILGHKSSLGKFRKIEIISSIFSDHNAMRLDINYRKNNVKNTWASLVVQSLRICLPMQGTQVRALVWEDPTCRGATRPMSHNC